MTVILDSLDQLTDYGAGLRDWIPRKLKGKVRLVLSAIPDDKFKVIPVLKKILPSDAFISVPPLEDSDISEILSSWFSADRRKLQPEQTAVLAVCKSHCHSTHLQSLITKHHIMYNY